MTVWHCSQCCCSPRRDCSPHNCCSRHPPQSQGWLRLWSCCFRRTHLASQHLRHRCSSLQGGAEGPREPHGCHQSEAKSTAHAGRLHGRLCWARGANSSVHSSGTVGCVGREAPTPAATLTARPAKQKAARHGAGKAQSRHSAEQANRRAGKVQSNKAQSSKQVCPMTAPCEFVSSAVETGALGLTCAGGARLPQVTGQDALSGQSGPGCPQSRNPKARQRFLFALLCR